MGSALRMYLYETDENGKRRELSDHPANGAEWSASGPSCIDSEGARQRDTMTHVVGYSPRACQAVRDGEISGEADYMLGQPFGFRRGSICLRAADFPGRLVSVKVWSPGEIIEWRLLA